VCAGLGEAQALEPHAQARADGFVHRELEKLHAVVGAGGRRREQHARLDGPCLALQRRRVFSSRYSSERRPSAAFCRGGAARKPSLKISSDSGPR
jgi:hypothetical protein